MTLITNACLKLVFFNDDTYSIGLSGNETAIDVGSFSYLFPLVDRSKVYDLTDFKQVTGSDPLFVFGAGAGPWPYVGVFSEVSFVLSNHDVENM